MSAIVAGRFDSKVVLVVGAGATPEAGDGNGRSTAIAFAREGAKVVAIDVFEDRAEATRALIEAEGGSCLSVKANVVRPEGARAAAEAALQAFGRIDVLHHNVGFGGNGDILTLTSDEWDWQFAGNAKSAFLCMQAVLPAMIAQGKGVITTTSSTLAVRFIEMPSLAYTAAKAAVEAMTRSVAVSHGPLGIRANCIRIGFMDTPLNRAGWRPQFETEADYDAVMVASERAVPLRRMGVGWDTAALALFLASDEASYLNGLVVPADGGVEHAPVHIEGLPVGRGR